MEVLLNSFVVPLFFSLVAQGCAVSVLFGKVVRLQYRSHRESWIRDGRPIAPFFYPPEARKWRGLMVRWSSWRASSKCFWAWLFDTPPWAARDGRASRLLYWVRALMLAYLAVFFGTLFFLVAA